MPASLHRLSVLDQGAEQSHDIATRRPELRQAGAGLDVLHVVEPAGVGGTVVHRLGEPFMLAGQWLVVCRTCGCVMSRMARSHLPTVCEREDSTGGVDAAALGAAVAHVVLRPVSPERQ